VLPRSPIRPGERGLARLRLEAPAVARGGDRFVLRSWSPVTTIGGGRVLDPDPPLRRATLPATLAAAEPSERLRALVERRANGLSLKAVPIVVGSGTQAGSLPEGKNGLRLVGGVLIATDVVDQTSDRAVEMVDDFHRGHRSDPGMPLETLRRGLRVPDWLADAAIQSATGAGRLVVEVGTVRRAGFVARVAGGGQEGQRLVQIGQGGGLTPPPVAGLERDTRRR